MRQRVMIAIALACSPDLLLADEPTTALDVTVQAEILDLIRDLCAAKGTAVLMISHDLGLIANMCRRVGVMYAGRIVETRAAEEVFRAPSHPYTSGLVASLPLLGARGDGGPPPPEGDRRRRAARSRPSRTAAASIPRCRPRERPLPRGRPGGRRRCPATGSVRCHHHG